ncbi:MAG: nucleotidyltransferase family protein [Beijerinckiaceae bacterium]|nr:nucleotidyltransferase family protein [Beijerinckiaceae bacterium]
MRPLTDRMPKPLITVAGKSLIDHVLDRFTTASVETAIVNVHYLASQVEAHVAARKTPRILISDERDKLLGQGGGIAKALPLLGREPFFIANTDAFWIEGPADNLHRLAAAWEPEQMDMLLLVAAVSESVGVDSTGDFTLTPDGRLLRRAERAIAPFVYTGVGIVKPELFEGRAGEVFPLAPFFFAAADAGRLFGERLGGLWLHVGTPEAIKDAERMIARDRM